jgi:hypothetical protein
MNERTDIEKPVRLSGVDTLRHQRELFSHNYLAIMSIVQGVTLHILIYHSMDYWGDIECYGYGFILYFFINLEILALLWYEYLYNMQFPRLANWKDTVFPIVLGVLQILLTYNLTQPHRWLLIAMAIAVIGYCAYRNTRISLLPWQKEYQPHIAEYIFNSQRKKEVGTAVLFLVLVVISILYYSFYNMYHKRINILDCLWFVIFTYITIIFFGVSNRLEHDLRELDRNWTYKPTRLRVDVLLLEPLLEWCVKRFYRPN